MEKLNRWEEIFSDTPVESYYSYHTSEKMYF